MFQQAIADYLSGKGLGYAKAAELNHFPEPRRVLDMADELDLTEQQIELSQAVFDTMQHQIRLYDQLPGYRGSFIHENHSYSH